MTTKKVARKKSLARLIGECLERDFAWMVFVSDDAASECEKCNHVGGKYDRYCVRCGSKMTKRHAQYTDGTNALKRALCHALKVRGEKIVSKERKG